MVDFLRLLKAIKLDGELLTPEEMAEASKIVKGALVKREIKWMPCNERPYRSMKCLIAYSDGEVEAGRYVHNSDFDHGGFFTCMREFDLDNTAEPLYWMPVPELPRIPSRVA